jgi:hypothetical protein
MAKNTLLEELKDAQKKVRVAEAQRDGIAAKLSEHENGKCAAHAAEQEIPELIKLKGDIQAEMALGNNSRKGELDQIGNKISKAQQDVEIHTQTVAGLNRSLAVAMSDLEQVKHPAHLLTSAFIRSEADRIQAEYLNDAKSLLAKFRQLQALGTLAGQNSRGDVFATGNEAKHLSIPVFQLEASGQWPYYGNQWPRWTPAIDITDGDRAYMHQDADAEKARLESMGITL